MCLGDDLSAVQPGANAQDEAYKLLKSLEDAAHARFYYWWDLWHNTAGATLCLLLIARLVIYDIPDIASNFY